VRTLWTIVRRISEFFPMTLKSTLAGIFVVIIRPDNRLNCPRLTARDIAPEVSIYRSSSVFRSEFRTRYSPGDLEQLDSPTQRMLYVPDTCP